jgi:hypothetical protein
MTPRKARKIVTRSSERRQVKSLRLKDVFGSDPKQAPAFIRRHRHETWSVAMDYQFIIRFMANLARSAARGVTAAEKGLDEIGEQMLKIREGQRQPGDTLFATHAEWRAFLNNKLAEWAEGGELSGVRLLLRGLKLCVRAAANGEPEAEMALNGVLRKLQKLAAEVSRADAKAAQESNGLEMLTPTPEQLQALFDQPS